jgi:hypothetical protein
MREALRTLFPQGGDDWHPSGLYCFWDPDTRKAPRPARCPSASLIRASAASACASPVTQSCVPSCASWRRPTPLAGGKQWQHLTTGHQTAPRVPRVSIPSHGGKMEPEDRRAEYAAAHDALLHFTAFRWQGGSFLSTGVFVFWGLLIQQKLPAFTIGMSTLLVSALMSVWILFSHQARQIYLAKLHRIHELERDMNMRQNLRFGFVARGFDPATRYRTFGPRGYELDLAVCVVTSIGGPLLGWARNGLSAWLILPLPLVVGVLIWVHRNDQAMLAALRSNPPTI